MAVDDFMAKIRHWDNQLAGWVIRHFPILFFQLILFVVFGALFVITINVIDLSADIPRTKTVESLLTLQTFNSLLITLLFLLNSFCMLYVFSGILRIRAVLKEISFNLAKRKSDS